MQCRGPDPHRLIAISQVLSGTNITDIHRIVGLFKPGIRRLRARANLDLFAVAVVANDRFVAGSHDGTLHIFGT